MSETPKTTAEIAHSRLQEFPDDPIAAANEAGKEVRMAEMEGWANAMGAHVERRQEAHRTVARQIIDSASRHGVVPPDAEKRLGQGVSDWRTGVQVDQDGNVEEHPGYPFSGDTPAVQKNTYRSPKNIPR